MSSRLFLEVRERRGLAYDVHSYISAFHDSGAVAVNAGVEPEQVDDVIATLRETCHARPSAHDAPAEQARAVVFVLDAPGFLQV
jgi:predicted Zn-dependent peptidase